MYYLTEQNERKHKRSAIVLTIAFHLALFTWLYFSASDKPSVANQTSMNKTEKSKPLTP
jgi:membrane protein involved in colicin uptake